MNQCSHGEKKSNLVQTQEKLQEDVGPAKNENKLNTCDSKLISPHLDYTEHPLEVEAQSPEVA